MLGKLWSKKECLMAVGIGAAIAGCALYASGRKDMLNDICDCVKENGDTTFVIYEFKGFTKPVKTIINMTVS